MDYRKNGFVSFWIGNLESGNNLEKLMEENYSDDGDKIFSDFSKLFKTGRYDDDFREACFFENGINNIADALVSFSYSEEFVSSFADITKNELGKNYNTIILLYNFQYGEKRREISSDKFGFLKFIGFTRYDYSKEALLSEVSRTLGEVPFEWKRNYSVFHRRRRNS